jgi:hypothetical protein
MERCSPDDPGLDPGEIRGGLSIQQGPSRISRLRAHPGYTRMRDVMYGERSCMEKRACPGLDPGSSMSEAGPSHATSIGITGLADLRRPGDDEEATTAGIYGGASNGKGLKVNSLLKDVRNRQLSRCRHLCDVMYGRKLTDQRHRDRCDVAPRMPPLGKVIYEENDIYASAGAAAKCKTPFRRTCRDVMFEKKGLPRA